MLYDSKLWIADLDEVVAHLSILSRLEGQTVLITGANGLICSALVDLLIRYNETHAGQIRILAAGRNEEKMRRRFGPYAEKPYFGFVPYDASRADNRLSLSCDYIIHGAGNASPDRIMREPVETMLSNFVGLRQLLQLAKETGTKRLLYISSSEIYGRKENALPYREEEYGFIDQLNSRNSYSVGKRAAETLCASYAAEYGVASVIVRPGHIYGPTASPGDSRVSSAWAFAAARGEDIVMKSDGSQLRSYCYCLDCASAILTVLLCSEGFGAFNISNPDSIVSIRQMAELLAGSAGVSLIREAASRAEQRGFNPMSNSSLDSSSLERLGWTGLFDAQRGFSHTVEILKETREALC